MTICPNCGKEYRITPDVCGECGTPLTVSDIADPFAEAVKEEAELREKARQRRAEQTADTKITPFTEEADGSDEITEAAEEVKPKRKKLRALAVTAALAVAAGGGWLGWKHFKGKDRPIAADVCFMDGNQPYFYDGQTGILHKLGEPIDTERLALGEYWQSNFWSETEVSADHSRIIFPKYAEKEPVVEGLSAGRSSYRQIPYCLHLTGKHPEQNEPFPMIGSLEGNEEIMIGSMLNRSGDRVLLVKSNYDPVSAMAYDDPASAYGYEYLVWQDPSCYDTELISAESLEADLELFEKAEDGSSVLLRISATNAKDEDTPVLVNPNPSQSGYEYFSLLRQNPDGTAGDPIASNVQNMQLNTIRNYTYRTRSAYRQNGNTVEKPRYLLYTCGREYDHIPEELGDTYTLRRGGTEIQIEEGKVSNAQLLSGNYDTETVTMPQSTAEQTAAKMMESGSFLVGTEVHRLDLQTGEDLTVAYESDNKTDLYWDILLNGDVMRYQYRGETPKSCIYRCENGAFEPEEIDADIIDNSPAFYLINNSTDLYYICRGGVPYLYVKGEPHKLVLDENTDLSMINALLSASGSRVLLEMGNKLDGTCTFICSLDGLSEGSEIVCEAVEDKGDTYFCGDYLINEQKSSVNYDNTVLSADGSVISSVATGNFTYADTKEGVLFFTEHGEDGNALCRWKDGVTTVITERVAYIADEQSLQVTAQAGGFAVVVPEPDSSGQPDKAYSIYIGDTGSGSLEECRKIWNSTERPVLDSAHQSLTFDSFMS